MFAVSYVIIFAFHPDLNFERVMIERSFGHSLAKLTSIDYLTRNQFAFANEKALLQLKDFAIAVSQCKDKKSISQMCSTELKFLADSLSRWFNKRFE